jgi:nucleotide-binding universal stress UspA family protein
MTAATPTTPRFIVAAVDGSDASKDALRWAVEQAERTGAEVHAVMTWEIPTFAYGAPVPYPSDLNLESSSRRSLDRVIDEIVVGHPSVKVSATVVQGHPSVTLTGASAEAELLVVGSRGHGAFAGMLLGSTSEYCVAHATCPVVVVRHAATAE